MCAIRDNKRRRKKKKNQEGKRGGRPRANSIALFLPSLSHTHVCMYTNTSPFNRSIVHSYIHTSLHTQKDWFVRVPLVLLAHSCATTSRYPMANNCLFPSSSLSFFLSFPFSLPNAHAYVCVCVCAAAAAARNRAFPFFSRNNANDKTVVAAPRLVNLA